MVLPSPTDLTTSVLQVTNQTRSVAYFLCIPTVSDLNAAGDFY